VGGDDRRGEDGGRLAAPALPGRCRSPRGRGGSALLPPSELVRSVALVGRAEFVRAEVGRVAVPDLRTEGACVRHVPAAGQQGSTVALNFGLQGNHRSLPDGDGIGSSCLQSWFTSQSMSPPGERIRPEARARADWRGQSTPKGAD